MAIASNYFATPGAIFPSTMPATMQSITQTVKYRSKKPIPLPSLSLQLSVIFCNSSRVALPNYKSNVSGNVSTNALISSRTRR